MYELKKNGKVFMSKFVGTGPSYYEKRNYGAAVSQMLRTTGVAYGSPTRGLSACIKRSAATSLNGSMCMYYTKYTVNVHD